MQGEEVHVHGLAPSSFEDCPMWERLQMMKAAPSILVEQMERSKTFGQWSSCVVYCHWRVIHWSEVPRAALDAFAAIWIHLACEYGILSGPGAVASVIHFVHEDPSGSGLDLVFQNQGL